MSDHLDHVDLQPEDIRSLVTKRGRNKLSAFQIKLGSRRRSDYSESDPLHAIYGSPRVLLRALGLAFFSVLIFAVSAAGFLYHDLTSRLTQSGLKVEQFMDEKEPTKPIDDYSGRPVNVLIMGTDSRVGEGNSQYGFQEGDETMRSDVTIIAHISADRSRVQLVSIPRDTIVDIPECQLKDGSRTPAQQGQFNWAMAIGSQYAAENLDAGIACVWRTAEELSGLTIDEYVLFDFAGFERMVNALGGVEMCFKEDVYDEIAGLDIKAGCRRVSGHNALAYARARFTLGDGSDISRIGRQQELMGNIFKTARSKNMFTNFPRLYSFLSETLASVHTSSNLSRLNVSAGLAYSLASLTDEGIQFVTLPYEAAPWDTYRVIPSWQAEGLWEALKNDQPIPGDIEVKNSSGQVISSDTTDPTSGAEDDQEVQ